MKRLFLEIDENEKNRILGLHESKKENKLVNEQFGGLLRNVGRAVLSELEKLLLKIPEIARAGYKNLDEILKNFQRLSAKAQGQVITTMFKNLKGTQRDLIARIIAKDERLIAAVFKETEEATRKAFKQSGKLADDEIESIIRAHKFNTTGSETGKWILNTGKLSAGGKTALQVVNNTKNSLLPALKSSGGKTIVLKPAQEKSLQLAITQAAKSGKLSWKQLINEFKKELKVTGALTLFFISTALYDWLSKQNITDLPPKAELVKPTTGKVLGDRVLRRGMTGPDVEELQSKLVLLGYNLGSYGANNNGIDGKFGPKTEEVVKKFQQDSGIKVDGLFGPESLKALNNTEVERMDSMDTDNSLDNLA